VVEPCGVVGDAVLLAGVGGGVGPLGCEGAVEAFDFAVGLGPVGPGAAVLEAVQGCGEVLGPVAGPVVGHHGGNGDPGGGEVGACSDPEGRCGLLAFVGEDLGVGQSGVVVDG